MIRKHIVLPALLMASVVGACGDDDEAADTATAEAAATTTGEAAETTAAAPTTAATAATTAAAPAATTASGGDGSFTIGFVSIWCSNPTVCGVNQAFQAEAEALGAEAVVIEADINDPVNSQIAAFDQLIAQGVDAIAFWPIDDASLQAPMQRAADAGIPLFAHDMYEDPTGLLVASILQGRELKAKQGAQLVCDALGDDGGQVLYGDFEVPIPTLVFLKEKFTEYLAECPGAELVATYLNPTDNVDGAVPAAQAALQANPDVEAVFNYNDPTGIGASIAATELGRDVYIDGYNLSQDGVDALAAGRIDVSWDYRSADIGQVIARTMIHYLDGTEAAPAPFTTVWPIAYSTATIGDFEPTDARLERIAGGEYLVDAEPDYITTGDAVPTPPDLPLPELAAG